jgi:hypothetical protein
MPARAPSTRLNIPRAPSGRRPTICLVLHAYQSPNIPDVEVEQAVRCIYQPLLRLHGAVAAPVTFNIQGCLLRRLETIAPEFLDAVRDLASGGILELTASAHYHPCLPLLTRGRRQRQIALNVRTVHEIFNIRANGFWPPELAWSPVLTEGLLEFDFRWTIVDGSAFIHAWTFQGVAGDQPAVLYSAGELTRPYAFASAPRLVAVPRQHQWSSQLFEEDALMNAEKLDAAIDKISAQAQGLVCLATDAERIGSAQQLLYERLLYAFLEFAEVSTTTAALERYAARETIDLPIWTWRGALDKWVRGEGERTFLRELDDAYRRRDDLSLPQDSDVAALIDDSLMRAESSCWLFWQTPCRFLAEGFAQIQNANRLMGAG